MLGGEKPTFGTATTGAGFGAFNNTVTSSSFCQSALGKPATSAFGAAPFSTQQTTSLFGSNTAQPQKTGLFGGASTSTPFGITAYIQIEFGNFSQPQPNSSIFGAAQPQANLSSQPAATSAFGSTVKPTGLLTFGLTGSQSIFGQSAAFISTSGFGTFGQTAPTTTSVFDSGTKSAFSQPENAATAVNPGTSIAKYQPTIDTDTLMKEGQLNSVNTKIHSITAMKDYDGKSFDELRMEDYLANRKGPQAGSVGGFGECKYTTQATTGTGLFGATSPPLVAFGQPATGGFGGTVNQPFGDANKSGFGAMATNNSKPFGAKPAFGQTAAPSLFGQITATITAPAFGQTALGFSTNFGSNSVQQQPSLFDQAATDLNKTAFGLGQTSNDNTGLGAFGNAATSTATGGHFCLN